MHSEIKYARNVDVSLAYQVVGDGERDLVFVLGFLSHALARWQSWCLRFPTFTAAET